jgi:hypothetical protein
MFRGVVLQILPEVISQHILLQDDLGVEKAILNLF